MISFNIKEKVDNRKKTKTYIYTFPNLKDRYISTFLSYCDKYAIPQDAVRTTLNQIF